MTETTVISEKFTVAYKRQQGNEIVDGFLGSDSNSGGYPFFDSEPDDFYLRDSLVESIKDAAMIETSMKGYYGHDAVDFDSIRVVRYRVVIETIANVAEAHRESLVKSARAKLSKEELGALLDNRKEE